MNTPRAFEVVLFDSEYKNNVSQWNNIAHVLLADKENQHQFYCEYGRPCLDKLSPLEQIRRMLTVETSMVCGTIDSIDIDADNKIIKGMFHPSGPYGDAASELLEINEGNPHSPHFGYRAQKKPPAKMGDPEGEAIKIICWDLLPE